MLELQTFLLNYVLIGSCCWTKKTNKNFNTCELPWYLCGWSFACLHPLAITHNTNMNAKCELECACVRKWSYMGAGTFNRGDKERRQREKAKRRDKDKRQREETKREDKERRQREKTKREDKERRQSEETK